MSDIKLIIDSEFNPKVLIIDNSNFEYKYSNNHEETSIPYSIKQNNKTLKAGDILNN
jgi:hypothetical protein